MENFHIERGSTTELANQRITRAVRGVSVRFDEGFVRAVVSGQSAITPEFEGGYAAIRTLLGTLTGLDEDDEAFIELAEAQQAAALLGALESYDVPKPRLFAESGAPVFVWTRGTSRVYLLPIRQTATVLVMPAKGPETRWPFDISNQHEFSRLVRFLGGSV